ncbi:hypothetical protein ILUMI_06720 [Ignelater luminosus]|uniref:CRC domain-containing protein n=1 Tax=Ignelater luminosus TaxID=2038154 RepID=A0A8K0GGY8_IGNLU|nr:hypothetical protein ILUMI_06720 [Ignelater luminosus]
MSLPIGGKGNSHSSEALVETLTVEGSTLGDGLTTNDLEQLAQLSHELHFTSDMDTTGSEGDVMETQEVQSEVVQPEIGAQEVEIETERTQSPEEILPDVKTRTNVPPLRPLTIAPKPTKVPITLKSAGGQQLLVLQGGAGGQPIKLVSSQGQGISVANLTLGKPITLRPTGKNITASTMSVLQPKQVIMKKVNQPQKIIADTKNIVIADAVKASQGSIVLPNPAKTITLAQAQQIGLLTSAKLVPQVTPKHIVVNKTQNKAIKIVPQTKTHTKILPAPQVSAANKVAQAQRIILKQTNANSSIVTPGQIIQVAGNQPLLTGQLHQINIPGKGVQYIKIVTPTTNTENNVSTASATNITTRQTIQTPTVEAKVLSTVATSVPTKSTNVILTEAVAATNIAPKPLKTTTLARPNTVHLPTSAQLVMLPASYIPQTTTSNAKVPIPAKPSVPKPAATNDTGNALTDINLESNGMRPRKPCNCTKSQCLKLYCDCFANGEFCYLCNCMNCFNNLENEEHRQRAIKSCLERNPNAFRPKIGKAKDTGDTAVRKHTKGCNCKRSGCLKNYCECYEAKIACSSNCKCMGCRNIEDSMDKKGIISQTNINIPIPVSPPLASKLTGSRNLLQFRPRRHSNNKHAFSFITDDVIEATSQCLLAISDTAETHAQDEEKTKCQIIEEFGRCLKEIIECSMNRNVCNTVN